MAIYLHQRNVMHLSVISLRVTSVQQMKIDGRKADLVPSPDLTPAAGFGFKKNSTRATQPGAHAFK